MSIAMKDARFLVLTGNYGSGKTELALNTALRDAKGQRVTLVDLDIVNPYFRSGEKADELREAGVRVLMPTFALTTVDIPALPAEIQSVFELPGDRVIFDVGGDNTGAAALGRYTPSFAARRQETCVALVVNCLRPLTREAEEIAELAERIARRARLSLDLLVNNTNLADATAPEMIEAGEETVLAAARLLGVSQVITCGREDLLAACRLRTPALPLVRHMKPEWMET